MSKGVFADMKVAFDHKEVKGTRSHEERNKETRRRWRTRIKLEEPPSIFLKYLLVFKLSFLHLSMD